jgi:hypothetical protein
MNTKLNFKKNYLLSAKIFSQIFIFPHFSFHCHCSAIIYHFISKYNFSILSQIDKKKTFFFPNVFLRILLFFRHGFSATLILWICRRRRTTHPPSKKNNPAVNPNPSSVKNRNHTAVIIHRSRGYKVSSFISSALKVTLPTIKWYLNTKTAKGSNFWGILLALIFSLHFLTILFVNFLFFLKRRRDKVYCMSGCGIREITCFVNYLAV